MTKYDFKDLKALVGEEAQNNDNYYRDPNHVTTIEDEIANGKRDSLSTKLAQWVRQKKYGIDVREAIARFIEWISVQVTGMKVEHESIVESQKNFVNRYEAQIAGNTDLNEIIDARGNFNLLGERMNAIDFTNNRKIEAYVKDNSTEVGGIFPDYAESALKGLAGDLRSSTVNIGFITDNHHQLTSYAPNSLRHYSYIAKLSRLGKLDAIVAGGDNINGYYDRNQILIEMRQVTSTLFNRAAAQTDVFFAMGNHDTGIGQNGKNKPGTALSVAEVKNFYQTSSLIYDEVRQGDSLYCYKDYAKQKLRMIILDSFDLPETLNNDGTYKYNFLEQSGFSGKQLKWLAEEALILPDNSWHVIIFTHACISGGLDTIMQYNTAELLKILNSFQKGEMLTLSASNNELPVSLSVDYSSQGPGVIVGVVSGHHHNDNIIDFAGFKNIETAASLCHGIGRTKDTSSEDAWDVFMIDTTRRSVSIRRFGYGSNRQFTY